MLEEKQINKIIELKEKGLTIKDIAKTVGVSESTVKKYTSEDYEKDNEIDEKTAKALSKQMIEEEYEFDEIKLLMYSFKLQADEIDVNLYDYLNDINNIMSGFLKITSKPDWFYYVFCELANSLSVFADHIDAEKIMEAIDNFYNREIEMEESESFLSEMETKAELLVKNAKEEYNIWQEKTNIAQKEYDRLGSIQTIMLNKMLDDPNKEKLSISEANLKNMEKEVKRLEMVNTILTKKCNLLEQPDKNNENTKQENILLKKAFEKINKLFPEEISVIIQEIGVENQ